MRLVASYLEVQRPRAHHDLLDTRIGDGERLYRDEGKGEEISEGHLEFKSLEMSL